jgi:molybdenum cofactor biosynthesis enzyme MoaA
MNIIDYLLENKEWLFSGAGVSLITLLYVIIRKITHNREKNRLIKNSESSESKDSYVEKIYELYKRSDYSNVIRTCTSSWPIDQNRVEVLLNLKAASITFLGPIRPGFQFLGVLWRIWISQRRSSVPFYFYHREEPGIKFVLIGNNVIISDSHDETPSKTGKSWDEFPRLTSILRSHFETLKMSSINLEDHICDEIIKALNNLQTKTRSIKDILRLLTDNQESAGFPLVDQLIVFEKYLGTILPKKGLKIIKNQTLDSLITLQPDSKVNMGTNFLLPAIRIVLTQECNYNCIYCPQCNENFSETKRTIPAELFSKFVGICKSYGFTSFRFTGGEPLIVGRNFFNIITENNLHNDTNYSIYLATNGSYLKSYSTEFEKISNLTLKVSLDTLNPIKYKNLAGIKSDYLEDILNSILQLKERIRIGINTVVTKDNYSELEELVNFSLNNRVYLKLMDLNWYFDQRPYSFYKEHFIRLTDFIETLKKKYNKYDTVKTIGNYGIPMTQFYLNEESWIKIKDHTVGSTYSTICDNCDFAYCQEGIYQMSLTADGKLKVCRHRPDTSIDISSLLMEGKDKEIHDAITLQLNRFFIDARFIERKEAFSPP